MSRRSAIQLSMYLFLRLADPASPTIGAAAGHVVLPIGGTVEKLVRRLLRSAEGPDAYEAWCWNVRQAIDQAVDRLHPFYAEAVRVHAKQFVDLDVCWSEAQQALVDLSC